MPWKIEQHDGEFCVMKEEDGSTVKCHKTRGEAVNHMKALYAAEGKDMTEKEMIEKCYPEMAQPYSPYGGATTFDELEAMREARESMYKIHDVIYDFDTLSSNIIASMSIENKAVALKKLAQELVSRLDMFEGELVKVEKKEWDTAYKNDLSDDSFLYVEPGEKEDGKTTPRTKRHFPYRDKSGKVDLPHVRNAIARIPQSNAPGLTAEKKESLQNKARKILEEHSTEKTWTVELTKALDEDRRLAYGIVLVPDVPDSQDDIMSAIDIEKAAHSFFVNSRIMDLQHQESLPASAAVPVESYIAPVDMMIGEHEIAKGSWVMVTYIPNDSIWEQVRKGAILSYSIKGYGVRTPVESE